MTDHDVDMLKLKLEILEAAMTEAVDSLAAGLPKKYVIRILNAAVLAVHKVKP